MEKIIETLVVCVPVFAVMAVGKLLERRGFMNTGRRHFVNELVYRLALPALIFNEVARQRFGSFFNPALVGIPLLVILLLVVLGAVWVRFMKYRGGFAAAFVFGTFWANVTYMGFPLARNAFGAEGLARAAIYNAFVMPVFIALGYLLVAAYGGGHTVSVKDKLRQAMLNPIILAALAGVAVAATAEFWRLPDGSLGLPAFALAALRLISSFLVLLGGMGLPLALLSIGAALHGGNFVAYRKALAAVVCFKLVVFPLLVWSGIRIFFPQADPVVLGVAVLLSATPNAVASYVVACQIGVEEGFVSAMLVLSTGLSVLTIPIWVYLVI